MSSFGNGAEDADIDLKGLVVAIWRRRMLVLASSVALGALAFGGASMVSPKYQSEARVLIEARSPDFANSASNGQADPTLVDEAGVASQVALLQSVDLIKKVARDFKLYERGEFDPSANPSFMTRLMVMAGMMKNPLEIPPEERVIKEFTEKLQVYQVDKSRVIAIQFSSKDPKLASAIPNAMADVYLSLQSGAKLDTTSETAKWLEPEIANLREKVREAEAKVASYRAKSDLYQTGQQSTFAEQQLNDISQEIAKVRADRASAQAKAESVRRALGSGQGADTLSDVVGSPMIQRLKETQSSIEGQIADLSTQLLDGHPRIKGLRSQLTGIRTQIREETRRILSSLENEASLAGLRERELLKQLSQIKTESATSEEKKVDLNALEREATAQRQLLETYLARYRAAVSEKDMNATPADGRIVSRAVLPTEAYFPKTGPITIVATLAGFLLSSVFVMLSELFSGRAIRRVEWVHEDEPVFEEKVAEALPVVPAHAQAPSAVAVDDAGPVMAKPPGQKKTQVPATDLDYGEFSVRSVAGFLAGREARHVACVSLAGKPGSLSVVALAREFADLGLRTVLVDLGLEGNATGITLENGDLPGMTDLLAGEAAYGDTLHLDLQSDAHVMPNGTADADTAMRSIERVPMILDALSNAYDCVVLDCGEASVSAILRLLGDWSAEIVLAAAGAEMELIEDTAGAFSEAGHGDIALMLESPHARLHYFDEKAA